MTTIMEHCLNGFQKPTEITCRWRVQKTPVRRDFSCKESRYNNRKYTINNKIKPREHKSVELTQKTKQTKNTTQRSFLSWDRIRIQWYKQRRKQNTRLRGDFWVEIGSEYNGTNNEENKTHIRYKSWVRSRYKSNNKTYTINEQNRENKSRKCFE